MGLFHKSWLHKNNLARQKQFEPPYGQLYYTKATKKQKMSEQEELNEQEEQLQATDMHTETDSSEQIEQLKADLQEAKSKYLYLYSDFESMRRNAAKERIETMATAGRDIITALLPILDDFERAAKATALSEGVELIRQKIENTLQSKGLRKSEIQVGDVFNVDDMEAVAELPAPNDAAKGTIVDVLEQGYTLGGKMIRYAKVVVFN
jgi:molecular chaperone GrpE